MAPKKLRPRDVCRLAIDQRISSREVGRLANVSPTTVKKYRDLMKLHGITCAEDLQSYSDIELLDLLQAIRTGGAKQFIEEDWDYACAESQKPSVTAELLHQEYLDRNAGKSGGDLRKISSYRKRLRKELKNRGLSMKQKHLPGREMYVDFSGKHLYLRNQDSSKKPVEIFVATLGASQMLFATAVASQKKPDWIEANVRALEYFNGVPEMIVPDNLKSAVIKPRGHGSEAQLNRSYLDFGDHYDTVIAPARPIKPQDKSLAEIGVRIVNMWVIAALRNHVFRSLDEVNALILPIVERLNDKRSRRLGSSRREIFEDAEAGCLKPLPATRHQYTEWYDNIRVPKDYHIQYNRDFYTVPFHLAGRTVSYCITRSTIRIFCDQSTSPVAVHTLGPGTGAHVQNRDHMPQAHKAYAGQNVEELLEWSDTVGSAVRVLFDALVANTRIPAISSIRQMSKAKKLAKEYGHQRLQSACMHANKVGTQSIPSVENILRLEIDLRQSAEDEKSGAKPVPHANVRGPAAYSGDK